MSALDRIGDAIVRQVMNEAQLRALAASPKTSGVKWGERAILGLGVAIEPNFPRSKTVVHTARFDRPVPFTLKYRFNAAVGGDGQIPDNAWTDTIITPAISVRMTLRRGIDDLGGVATEFFGPGGVGLTLPRSVLAHSLGIDWELLAPAGTILAIETLAVVTDAYDFLAASGSIGGGLGGYSGTLISRTAVNVANVVLCAFAPTRRQLIIANNSATATLFVKFGSTAANIGAGTEDFTFFLAPGSIYEGPIGGYTGDVQGIWNVADAAGEALVTQGFPP